MTDYLGALIDRHLDAEPRILPRLPSIYEPETPFSGLDATLSEKPGGLEGKSAPIEPYAPISETALPPDAMAPLSQPPYHAAADQGTTRSRMDHQESTFANLGREPTPAARPPKSPNEELVQPVTSAHDGGLVENGTPSPLGPTPSRADHNEPTFANLARDPTPAVNPPTSRKGELAESVTTRRDNGTAGDLLPRPTTRHVETRTEPLSESRSEPSAKLPKVTAEHRTRAPRRSSAEPQHPLSRTGTLDPIGPKDALRPPRALGDTAKPSHPPLMPSAALMTPAVPPIPLPERPTPKPEPVINVTIGRVEVRATMPSQKQPAKPATRPPVMGLDEYLQRRSGRHDR